MQGSGVSNSVCFLLAVVKFFILATKVHSKDLITMTRDVCLWKHISQVKCISATSQFHLFGLINKAMWPERLKTPGTKINCHTYLWIRSLPASVVLYSMIRVFYFARDRLASAHQSFVGFVFLGVLMVFLFHIFPFVYSPCSSSIHRSPTNVI